MIGLLTYEEAKKIGIHACIDKLGRDFVRKYRETSCSAYGDMEDFAYCFVGVSNIADDLTNPSIVLSSAPEAQFPYIASCNVEYADGKITFLECILPTDTTA
ncbi:MAG: hypothetical protein K1W22_12105 [Lachnospiraceae bacterium]